MSDEKIENAYHHGLIEKDRGKQVRGEPTWPLARRALGLPEDEQ